MKILFNVRTPLGKQVRTSEEYWREITTYKHPQLAGKVHDVELTLVDPERIKKSRSDEHVYLYYRLIGKYVLCVVVKHFGDEGFVITAYFTGKEKITKNGRFKTSSPVEKAKNCLRPKQ